MSSRNDIEKVMDCEAIQELIADYAFGLASAEDARFVEANLPRCPEATAQLADFRSLQDEMRSNVRQIEPPAHLSSTLIAAVGALEKPRWRGLPWAWVATAAAVLALIVTNVYWVNRVNNLSQEQTVLATPTVISDAFVFTRASDIRWVRLPPSQEDTNASAFLMWNAESAIGLLYVQSFPQLAPGRTYQLWFTRGEERVSAGTFHVDEEGKGTLLFTITEAIDDFTWSRITEEPEDGSPTPTGPVVVNGEL